MNPIPYTLLDSHPARQKDTDPQETAEWLESFDALLAHAGTGRAAFMLDALCELAWQRQLDWQPPLGTPNVNTIPPEAQPPYPGDPDLEKRLAGMIRWNALAMVVRANEAYGGLGGHIASYASAADLFEVGFNHFFRARNEQQDGDLLFLQPHSAPGAYARAFLEGRLTEADLLHFRQEITGSAQGARGLSSYPHPHLMPDFWQFSTGSMGIGPMHSIYQARFMRYLTHRGLLDCSGRRVWGMFGDGEMDEPESMAALGLAAREHLDNLVWVVNCNLQRLDGPVRGNARIIEELEKQFLGAGWNVVKVLWGSTWDPLFARDRHGVLTRALTDTVDGQMQTFAARDGRYNRERFFGQNPQLAQLVEGLSDQQIDELARGGHDPLKIHAAYAAAQQHQGAPTVILAHTKKGYGMGASGQGRMTTHSQKSLKDADLLAFRDRFGLPLADAQALRLEFYRPAEDSPELRYLRERRQALGGPLPARHAHCAPLAVPPMEDYAAFALQPAQREYSTTMAFVRMLGSLLKDKVLGPRIVPIVADEARTFGMANLFRQVGIYSSVGQLYEPEDEGTLVSYREAKDGQILEEGISEAGAISSWTAAATSHSNHGFAMLPFYIYYSMFGFQRVGDLIWAAADQNPRGFLIGATSGRTTLAGEGLQHQDGASHLWASAYPNCKAYDPAFAAELAVIIDHGAREMLEARADVFYYITVMNENYAQMPLPAGAATGVIRGAYCLEHLAAEDAGACHDQDGAASQGQVDQPSCVTLMGSGAILTEVRAAARILAAEGVACTVLSVTSWSELARDGQRWLESRDAGHGGAIAHVRALLAASGADRGPIIAASDYVRLVAESIRAYLPADRLYVTLGTDGFGRSDTRAALRQFFGVDAASVAEAARRALRGVPTA
ncbi:pyruvate dehydrogenase (acetyl-transferring), homodimeric type [Castellaniella sp.]|uniref:pyruvate dehydrogenase (acetyl-transferring), homodimeric type n=1 Tax=Castellaniella sp. TaxID=1955812 RepID=UPI0035606087